MHGGRGIVFAGLICLLVSERGVSQNVGVGEPTPNARVHINVPSGYGDDLFRVDYNGSAKFIVKNNGFVGVNRFTPAVPLHVDNGTDASPAGGGYLQIGNNGQNIVIDDNEIMSRATTTSSPSNLHINADGGKVFFHYNIAGSQSVFDPAVGLGIGTPFPSERLDVRGNLRLEGAFMPGNVAGSAGDILVSQGPGVPPSWVTPGTGSVAPLCATAAANYIQKWTGSELCNSVIYEEPLTGNVGVNTNAPLAPFEIEDTPTVAGYMLVLDAVGTGSDAGIMFDAVTDGGNNYNTGLIVADAVNGGTTPRLRLMVIDDDGTGWDTVLSLAPKVGVNWGMVGINTDNPQHHLHVEGTVDANYLWPGLGDGTIYRYIRFGDPATFWAGFMWNNTSSYYGDGDDFTIYTYDNGSTGRDIYLRPAGTSAKVVAKTSSNWPFRIENGNGYIRFGPANTSGAHIYTDLPKFFFNKDIWFGIEEGAGQPDTISSYCDGATSCGDGRADLVIATHGAGRIYVQHSTGNVGIGLSNPPTKLAVAGLTSGTGATLVYDAVSGAIYYSSSSSRFKENIRPFTDNWKKILDLRPVEFKYKHNNMWSIGYVAEQMDSVGLSDLLVYDNDGQPYSVKYELLSIYIIELLKEYEHRLATLEQEIKLLRSENEKLKSIIKSQKTSLPQPSLQSH